MEDALGNRNEVPTSSFIETLIEAQLSGVNSYLGDKKKEHKSQFVADLKYEYIPQQAKERKVMSGLADQMQNIVQTHNRNKLMEQLQAQVQNQVKVIYKDKRGKIIE